MKKLLLSLGAVAAVVAPVATVVSCGDDTPVKLHEDKEINKILEDNLYDEGTPTMSEEDQVEISNLFKEERVEEIKELYTDADEVTFTDEDLTRELEIAAEVLKTRNAAKAELLKTK